jgi:hypothetical protein
MWYRHVFHLPLPYFICVPIADTAMRLFIILRGGIHGLPGLAGRPCRHHYHSLQERFLSHQVQTHGSVLLAMRPFRATPHTVDEMK